MLFAGDRNHDRAGFSSSRRRGRLGWSLLLLALFGTVLFALLPSPYVIERPGPVFNTLGTVQISGKQTPVIEVPQHETWPTTGSLDLLTVSLYGEPDNLPNWLDVAAAWLDPSQAVLPLNAVYPPGYSVEDSNKQGQIDMQNSQRNAVAAALRTLGYPVPATVTVAALTEQSASQGILETGDVLSNVDGTRIDSINGLRDAIAAAVPGVALDIGVVRHGKPLSVSVTPRLSTGPNPVPLIGIGAQIDYDYPFEVNIHLANVGGPSAGQMFALGVIDKLTSDSLTGGKRVAGTGTIDDRGNVGAIGGIREKMYGAHRAGATIFLAPYKNCDDVVGHVPEGLTVFAVKTLKDSLHDLRVVSSGDDIHSLATCSSR